jgi:dTDP-4-amino-4,6-dideoxygalactose transaminase
VVALPPDADREAVIATLESRGAQTARYLPCIHLQPYMQERFGYRVGLCPVAEEMSSRTLALPFHARLPEEDQQVVAEALRDALQ